jgi:hypothetical protein
MKIFKQIDLQNRAKSSIKRQDYNSARFAKARENLLPTIQCRNLLRDHWAR